MAHNAQHRPNTLPGSHKRTRSSARNDTQLLDADFDQRWWMELTHENNRY